MTAAYQLRGAVRDPLPDGRRHYVFSQSKLREIDLCAERGRRGLLGLTPHTETDSTALGSAVHLALEMCVVEMIGGSGPMHPQDMCDIACDEFDRLMAAPEAVRVKFKTDRPVYDAIARCVTTWYRQVLPSLDPLHAELHFGPVVFCEDAERVIEIEGTIDYVDRVTGLADWKTASRAWEPWEHQRWDIQPTLYTAAWELLYAEGDWGKPYQWTWHVMLLDGGYQKVTTTRGPADWAWLQERMVTVAKLLEAELPEWPKNDNSALCSPKFCPVWQAGECKGRHFGQNWPK